MKSLRLLVFGMAIGVLAILANTRLANAATHHHHHRNIPRLTRSVLAPSTRASNGSHSNSRSSRRPAPPPPNRTATRVRSHRHFSRTRPDQPAALASVQGVHPENVAWRIGPSLSLNRGFSDASVTSERGPPRAGPQLSIARVPRSARKLPSLPRLESQSILRIHGTIQYQPRSTSIAATRLHLFPQGIFRGPPRADRQEGTAACISTPSLGELR